MDLREATGMGPAQCLEVVRLHPEDRQAQMRVLAEMWMDDMPQGRSFRSPAWVREAYGSSR